ncbi:MAG: hypothetical protein N4A44_02760 [Alphaproteobacteria bacterium]|jgi:tRNA threonylcarbamoyladenosine biosynthesis protein TsaB|nr:hypothetical protein [Alphaproteobacteria bacterium]
MSNTLLINTVINKPSISYLTKNSSENTDLFLDSGKDQIGKILPLSIEAAKNKDIKNISCIIGPGSFTSIRIGLSLAKGISVAKNIPLKSLTTFEYMLNTTEIKNCDYILCAIDSGKKNNYFIQLFSKEKNPITNTYEYTFDEIENLLQQYENTIILSNVELNLSNQNIQIWNQKNININLLNDFLNKQKNIKPVELKALYIRPHYAIKKT